MKFYKIILVCSIVLFQLNFAQEKSEVIFSNALKEAKAQKKNVLLVFHASWCKWCHVMQKNMNLPETKPIFEDKFVTAYIDVQERGEKKKLENPVGQLLMNTYKGENAGLPFWLILNPHGEVLADSFDKNGDNLGCPSTEEEVAEFVSKLNKVSKINKNQLETIQKVFTRKN